jgi:hypothetical protein
VADIIDLASDLDRLIEEALRLRQSEALPSIDQGPAEVLAQLALVRTRLDRLEELLSIAVRFRGRIREALKAANASVEDRWAEVVSAPSRRPRAGSDGWSGSAPRERYAEADLATLDQKRVQRRVEKSSDLANDAVDLIRQAHRGLDSTRLDLHLILRAMSVESFLER